MDRIQEGAEEFHRKMDSDMNAVLGRPPGGGAKIMHHHSEMPEGQGREYRRRWNEESEIGEKSRLQGSN
jgi:hypothetical protein